MKKRVLVGLLILITFFAMALSDKPIEKKTIDSNNFNKEEQSLQNEANHIEDNENNLEEISLNQFLSDYFPECIISKQFEIVGKLIDYDIAYESQEIIILTENSHGYFIYFMDFTGRLIWQNKFEHLNSSGMRVKFNFVKISNNGSVIVVTKSEFTMINMVYDNSGKFLFEKSGDNSVSFSLKPTPDGEYLYEEMYSTECRIDGFYIYDKTGEEIEITGYDFSEDKWIRPVFINENKVVMYMEDKICFFNFNFGHFNLISEFELDQMHSFREAFQEDVLFSEKYVIISNQNSSMAQAYLFNNHGEFIREFFPYDTAIMIDPDRILIRSNHADQKYLKIININENKVTHDLPIKFREYYEQSIELDEVLLVSRPLWDAQQNRISSFIFDKENLQKISGINEICISTDKKVIFLLMNDDICVVKIGEVQK